MLPLEALFSKQIEALRAFLFDPSQTMVCVLADPDWKKVFLKILTRFDLDDDDPHIYLRTDTPFQNATQFFAGCWAEVEKQYRECQTALKGAGVGLDGSQEMLLRRLAPEQRLVEFLSALADAMPDSVVSLVLLIDPKEVTDPKAYRVAMQYLADHTPSARVKYIVLDQQQQAILKQIELHADRAQVQTFHISPDQLAEKLGATLDEEPDLPSEERRRYLALLGGIRSMHKDYGAAQRLQEECLVLAERDGAPAEQALHCYNLGNTLFHRGDLQEAEHWYGKAIELALAHDVDTILPFALTNLALAEHRHGRIEEAIRGIEVARKTWRAQGFFAGEGYALSCLAELYESEKRSEEAEQAWQDVLSLYDENASDGTEDIMSSGRADVVRKLEQHFVATKQQVKLDQLRAAKRN
jgi:tetratricopeptide (TPR) repeat protein